MATRRNKLSDFIDIYADVAAVLDQMAACGLIVPCADRYLVINSLQIALDREAGIGGYLQSLPEEQAMHQSLAIDEFRASHLWDHQVLSEKGRAWRRNQWLSQLPCGLVSTGLKPKRILLWLLHSDALKRELTANEVAALLQKGRSDLDSTPRQLGQLTGDGNAKVAYSLGSTIMAWLSPLLSWDSEPIRFGEYHSPWWTSW